MKHTIIDFNSLIESVRKDSRQHDYIIDQIEVYEDFLHFERKYIDNVNYDALEYFLFPNENIGIYKFYLSSNLVEETSKLYKFYVDMVEVKKYEDYWDVLDLYLDFIVKSDNRHYVVDVDEFNDAIERHELNQVEIKNGLNGLNCILKGYYESYSVDKYIEKLKSNYCNSKLLLKSNLK